MGVSKVTLNGVTLMDVTDKTVDTDNLLAGNSALRNDGESITGAVVTASPSDASPAMDGTASAGVATTYSRGDHVHPSDTNKANINNPSFTGIPTAPTASKGTDTTQIATTAFVQSAITDINYPVTSVNSKTGTVVLTASDVNALPDDTEIPTKTSDLTNDSGYITNLDIPVTSVNTKTGDVVLTAADVNAQPQINISGILKGNGTGTITAATAGTDYQAPLPSQTGNTGKFLTTNGSALSWQTVDALPSQSGNAGKFLTTNGSSASWAEVDVPTKTSELTNDSNFVSDANYVHTDNNFTGTLKTKLEGIAEGAEVNQNAFSNVKVGTSTIAADTKTDTLTLTAGSNITLTPDTTNDAVTIAATVPTKVSDLTNDSNFITAAEAPVQSVNSKTGTVTLTASDVGALPDSTTYVSSVNGNSGAVTVTDEKLKTTSQNTQGNMQYVLTGTSSDTASTKNYANNLQFGQNSNNGSATLTVGSSSYKGRLRLFNNASGSFYTNLNPSAVSNNLDVELPSKSGTLALTSDIPDSTSDLTNDSGFITNSDIPVTSVNSKTGAVVLTAADVGALSDTTAIPTATSDLTNDSGFITSSDIPVISVNNKTGAVSLTASDIGALPSSTDLSVYMQKGVDYVTAGKKTDTTLGTRATAEGQNNTASGNYSHAEGYLTTASGSHTHTEGQGTTASGQYGAHAEGQATTASGSYGSHAEGSYTTASSSSSHAEGQFSSSIGSQAHSEGYATLARGTAAHSEGSYTRAYGNQAHAEGIGTNASASYSHAEGSGTYYTIHVTAGQSEKEYNITEDNIYIPYGANYSNFGIMDFTYAKKWYLVTGTSTQGADPQKKLTSITLDEALSSSVIQNNAPLTLVLSGAVHNYSHVEGQSNISGSPAQHVGGKFNVVTSGAEVIGGGTSNTERANIRTLDWSGNEVLAGKLTVGAGPTNNMDVATKTYVDTAISNIDVLPDQTGQSGKFLTTNGTTASWADNPPEIFWITVNTSTLTADKTFAEIAAAVGDNKLPIVFADSNSIYLFLYLGSTYMRFTRYVGASGKSLRCNSDDTWEIDYNANLQEQITASGLLKGDGAGGVTAATASDIPSLDYVSKVTSSDNAVVRFNGTSGEVQNSGVTIDDNNVLLAPAMGTSTNTYIEFPDGGGFRTTGSTQTGYLKITLPQSWTDTMMSFKVQMYHYNQNTSCEFTIGGYNYSSGDGTWTNRPFAYSIGKSDVQTYSNLTVRLGHDGTKCAVYIGEANTSWQYMQIQVHDVLVGYKNYEYDKWATGWSVGFTTTLGTVTATITNPCVSYYAATAGTATSATSATSATTATTAGASKALNFVQTNELLLGNTNAQNRIWINYRRVENGATSGNTAITEYHFGNGNAGTTGVTLYAANFSGVAAKATAANITTTANAIATYSNTTGTFSTKATASGAAYATSANGALTFGTLPIAQGGTGKTSAADAWTALGGGASGKHADSYFALASHKHAAGDINSGTLGVARGGTGAASFTANCVIMSNTTTTGALTTRAVTNNTSATALAANTNIPTQNTVYYGLNHRLNRTTAVNAADTGYTTIMARGMGLRNADTNPSLNGAINWTYG